MADTNIETKKLEFEKEKFEFFKDRIHLHDALMYKMAEHSWDYEYVKLAVILILIIIVIFFASCKYFKSDESKIIKTQEDFLPMTTIFPQTVLDRPIFDSPLTIDSDNKIDSIDPYHNEKSAAEDKLFGQTHEGILTN